MGKRYNCDYCGKSFPDNVNNRKKHLKGVHHNRLRKLHYESFRDASTVLRAEALKKPCRCFLQTGYCDYGATCKFSHLRPEEVQRLSEQAEIESKRIAQQHQDSTTTLEGWLQEHRHNSSQEDPFGHRGMLIVEVGMAVSDKPPSMLPPTYDDLLVCQSTRWG